ncbi:hypothetical protein BECAL_02726 [Bellilinea caldifistulae]|mgnify:CR=1 FL=1|uniref:Uncharacterized protein n=1 Tax=Bellilinea caldifistulae TaxID=360411 RepID=A0A0P6XJM6_9CHLR|nr:hypothetical protein [Bellilinea caldifistulae]KPL75965.1 hypothetical protein AC812_08375 [Bellilinea caldifistulae]GAP11537.1 hypothetical protein BECAL_02726 [Bellilinea caldifistulae]
MSKKQKRRVSSSESISRESPAKSSQAPTGRYSASAEFNPDYTPIIKDLKRIGVLAGSFIALLIVLSFFLR